MENDTLISPKTHALAPNDEYLELTLVKETATGRGLNTQIVMENLHDGNFRITDGRIGITVGRQKPREYTRPMSDWNGFFQSRSSRGYLVTKQRKTEKKTVTTSKYAPIEDPSTKDIVSRLMLYADQAMEENFKVKVADISDEMIRYGTEVLDSLALGYQKMSVAEFNNKLQVLYAAVPRRIDKLSDKLARQKSDMQNIVAAEQEIFELMVSQVRNAGKLADNKLTILDTMGLTWRPATNEEKEYLVNRMGRNGNRLVNAWRITNQTTEARFKKYCRENDLTDENEGISHLFHGSRTENWWSIATNGLTINPTGVVITGKAYGYGTYFAPSAQKSIGYTSQIGSKWANGSDATGFLGLYKVATGDKENRYNGSGGCNSSLSWKMLQSIKPGAHSTWAEAQYSGFVMDEVIVYQDSQDTIEYLIEFS